jgi:hypothetical protein
MEGAVGDGVGVTDGVKPVGLGGGVICANWLPDRVKMHREDRMVLNKFFMIPLIIARFCYSYLCQDQNVQPVQLFYNEFNRLAGAGSSTFYLKFTTE